jgi:hypothetical protein
LALVVLSATGAGCTGLPANPTRPRLMTFADLEALAAPTNRDPTFAHGAGVPGGLRVSDFISFDGTSYHLPLRSTWTEGYRSAYETTEVWTGFDEVWVQPVYVAITGFTDGKPDLLKDPAVTDPTQQAWSPIFSVGPGSAFYSPFWQTIYFQVPLGTDPDKYKSARQVLDSGATLTPGPGHTMAIVPAENVIPAMTVADYQPVGGPTGTTEGYLDGQDVRYLDFGKDNFSWSDDLDVEETPLFMLLYRDSNGELQKTNTPAVAGTGPLYANRPVNVTDSVPPIPHYGAYWRLYTVELPATARIFAPAELYPTESADFAGPVATTYGASVISHGVIGTNQWLGRVALNALPSADGSTPGCFDDYENLDEFFDPTMPPPEPCDWLDSQAKLERAVPSSAIQRTDITVTCPFVSYQDMAVVVTP